jgi:imidazolonepropionase-like amidohydrolase
MPAFTQQLFVDLLGFTPMEAILAGTALGGEILMHPNELGKVQPGFFADLIVVNGNPLDDIKLLSSHKNLDVVMIVSSVVGAVDRFVGISPEKRWQLPLAEWSYP